MTEPFDPSLLPPLVLAYVGDAVHDLEVRARLVEAGVADPETLHRLVVAHVRAAAQARSWQGVRDSLTAEEAAVARRGRNAKTGRSPRGTTSQEYHDSTAFEALLGFLYLSGRTERLKEIMALARSMGEGEGPGDGGKKADEGQVDESHPGSGARRRLGGQTLPFAGRRRST